MLSLFTAILTIKWMHVQNIGLDPHNILVVVGLVPRPSQKGGGGGGGEPGIFSHMRVEKTYLCVGKHSSSS